MSSSFVLILLGVGARGKIMMDYPKATHRKKNSPGVMRVCVCEGGLCFGGGIA